MSNRPVALITGASSGIGAALANTLADRGYDLVLLARRSDRLNQVAARVENRGARAETFIADLATQEGLGAAAQRAAHGDVQLLISNAGTGGYAPLREVSAAELDRLWRLNATAPITLTHAVVPSLLDRGTGAIVTIASLLAFSGDVTTLGPVPMPARTLYAAAKSATIAFTRTLSHELADTAVNATVICPGRVATEWSGNANQSDQSRIMSAEDVATATAIAVERGETICIPGLPQTNLVEQLQQVEHTLLIEGNRSELAHRYTAP